MNRDAVTAFQAKKYEDARKVLKQALDLASSAGLDKHPIKARTHIHFGIVAIVGFNQRDLGIKQFKKAIEIQSDIGLTKALVTPDLTAAFNEAKGSGAPATPATPPATPPPTPATPPPASTPSDADVPASGLVHEAVSEGKAGERDLNHRRCRRRDGVRKIDPGVPSRGGVRVPGPRDEGSRRREIRPGDSDQRNVGQHRRLLHRGRRRRRRADRGARVRRQPDGDSPAGRGHQSRDRRRRDDGEEDDDEEGPDHRYFVGMLIGSGVGWASGNGDTNADIPISPSGLAVAGVGRIAPEVGYWLSSSLMLSLQLRYEYITGTTDIYETTQTMYEQGLPHGELRVRGVRQGDVEVRFGEVPPVLLAGGGRWTNPARRELSEQPERPELRSRPQRDVRRHDRRGTGAARSGRRHHVRPHRERSSGVLQVNSVLAFPDFSAHIDANVRRRGRVLA